MKLSNLLESFILAEGISDVVYHGTDIHSAFKILNNNEFRLSTTMGTPAETGINNKYYYLSTTRSVLGAYHRDPHGMGVLMQLNGKKLGNNYKAKPVDYWGPDFRKIQPDKNEMEDRVFSDSHTIDNATKYIDAVHFYVDTNVMDAKNVRLPVFRKAYMEAKKNGIPVFVYDNRKSFLTLNTKDAIKPSELQLGKGADRISLTHRQVKNPLDVYVELYYKNKYDDLSPEAKKRMLSIKRSMDSVASLSADIHNNKSSKNSDNLIKIFKKENIRSAKDYIEFLKGKWKGQ
jgi:hypothetical protein